MSATLLPRVGWCPGALRPMLAGDGLLVRVKPHGGRLSVNQGRALAGLARRHGNGALTITSRANLQLRGIREADLPVLIQALATLDLLDPTPEGEAVRNVVASPLAGHDAEALLDGRTIVAALEERLVTEPAFWLLPPKFAWLVDDGGSLDLGGVPADIRFEAAARASGPVFAIRLAGAEQQAAECAPGEVSTVAASLAAALLGLCAERGLAAHRMRDLTAVCGAPIIFQRAGLAPRAGNVSGEASKHHRTGPPIGLGLQGPFSWVGVASPFGRLDAVALARFADAVGTDDICLTPWRTLLAPGLDEGAAQRLWAELSIDASGLITNPADPRLNVAACSGAPACIRATTPVQADAALLAKAVPYQGGIAVHVSGCAKGCAHAQAAPMTLVGRDGAYDLVRNGKAGAMPVLRGLPIAELVAMLEHDPAHSLEGGASVKLQEHLF